MIVGLLSDVSKQKGLLPAAVVRALEALQQQDLATLEPGRYEIDGDKLFYMVQDAMPRSLDGCKSEAHRTYADIQLPLTPPANVAAAAGWYGKLAMIATNPTTSLSIPNPDNEFFMDIDPGAYVVFLPGEPHRPCVLIKEQTPYRKIVMKVHHSLLGL